MNFMKKINNRGIGKIELMTMLGLLAVLFAFGIKMFMDNIKNYSFFEDVAIQFSADLSKYKDKYPKGSNIYYLSEAIEKGYSKEVKNPLNTSENCDKELSYIKVDKQGNKFVNLVCGEYVVEGYQSDGFKVYEVTEWHEKEKKEDNDTTTWYNYTKDETNEEFLEKYVPEDIFMKMYKEIEHTTLYSIDEVEGYEGQKLLTKTMYRQKNLVKDLK